MTVNRACFELLCSNLRLKYSPYPFNSHNRDVRNVQGSDMVLDDVIQRYVSLVFDHQHIGDVNVMT